MSDKFDQIVGAKRRDITTHKMKGFVEHSHTILKCSACDKPLLDVVVTQPHKDYVSKYRAECPYCPPSPKGKRQRSFPVTIKGGVIVGLLPDEEVIRVDHVDLDDMGDGEHASVLFLTMLHQKAQS